MISLTTRQQLREVRNLPFCYICGETLTGRESTDYDHAPPQAVFDKLDRDFPLKLAVHKVQCHASMNLDDEVMGQLIALIHGKQPSERDDRLKLDIRERKDGAGTMAAFDGLTLEQHFQRWIKAFHAALYHIPLDTDTQFAIQTPFPSVMMKNGQVIEEPIKHQHYVFVECIKKNRLIGNLDRIQTNNGKLLYECVWDKLSDDSWGCVFALDLYGWKALGDVNNFPARGCAGFYRRPCGTAPINACLGTGLDFPFDNIDTADPFAR